MATIIWLENPLPIVLIEVPLILQTFLIFFIAYVACKLWNSMKNGKSVALTKWGQSGGKDN